MAPVQAQEGLRGAVGGLTQQRQAHEQASRPVPLAAGRLILLQRLVEPVLKLVHRVRTVHRVGVWRTATGGETLVRIYYISTVLYLQSSGEQGQGHTHTRIIFLCVNY